MTFPWARILLMLIIVGLSSIFLINSHVLVLASTPFDTSATDASSVDMSTDTVQPPAAVNNKSTSQQ